MTEETAATLGKKVALECEWKLDNILQGRAIEALEDGNFHAEAAQLTDLLMYAY